MKRLAWCFLLLLPLKAWAQGYLSLHYTMQDGLPSNTIYRATQDQYGHIWLATDAGVSRFDGTSFTNFTILDGLADLDVVNIFKDSKERLWMGTYNGRLCCYASGKFWNSATMPILDSLANTATILNISEDHKGGIWVFTHSNLVSVLYPDQNWKRINTYFSPRNKDVMKLMVIGPNTYMVGTRTLSNMHNDSVLFRYRVKEVGAHNIALKPKGGVVMRDSIGFFEIDAHLNYKRLASYTDLGILSENVKRLVAFEDEYWITMLDGGTLQIFANGTSRHVLPEAIVNNVDKDRDNNYWVSTHDGLYFLPAYFDKGRIWTDKHGLPDSKVTALYSEPNGRIWLGFKNATFAVLEPDGIAASGRLTTTESVLKVTQILPFRDKLLFCTRDKGLFELHTKNLHRREIRLSLGGVLSRFYPRSLKLHPNGMPTCVNMSSLAALEPGSPCFTDYFTDASGVRIFMHYWDRQGRLWLSRANGLGYVENNTFIPLPQDKFPVLKEEITSMLDVGDGRLLLSPKGYGLCMWTHDSLTTPLTTAQGLPGNLCHKLIMDNGQIWANCATGIAEIGIEGTHLFVKRYFDQSNSILSGQINDMALNDKHILVATDLGMIVMDRGLSFAGNYSPKVTIIEVATTNRQLTDQQDMRIFGTELPLRIRFKAFMYPQNRLIQYQYRLNDDENWRNTTNTALEFSELASGRYILQLRARVPNTDWGPVNTYAFTIRNVFYREPWFYILCTLLIAGGISGWLWWYRQKKDRTRQQTLENELMLNRLENQALQTVMHPHFMFNALNSIQHFLNDNDRLQANRYLSRFAKLMRINLSAGIQGYLSLEEEKERLLHYIGLEALRLEKVFEYEIIHDPALSVSDTFLPAMLLQPYVENALWHGLEPAGKDGHLMIRFLKHDDKTLHIIIEDDGIGLENSLRRKNNKPYKSQALDIIRKRLELLSRLFGMPCSVTMAPLFPERSDRPGNSVTIVLPLVDQQSLSSL